MTDFFQGPPTPAPIPQMPQAPPPPPAYGMQNEATRKPKKQPMTPTFLSAAMSPQGGQTYGTTLGGA